MFKSILKNKQTKKVYLGGKLRVVTSSDTSKTLVKPRVF